MPDDAALARAKELAAAWCRAHAIYPNGELAADLVKTLRAYGDEREREKLKEIIDQFRYWQAKAGDESVPWQIIFVGDPRKPLTDSEICRGQEIAALRAQEEKA